MKISGLILALYLCLLSVYPCNDREACNDETEISLVDSSGHGETGNDQEVCSPLCICSCCATSIQLAYSLEVALPSSRCYTPDPTIYVEKFHPDDRNQVWQPPKLS